MPRPKGLAKTGGRKRGSVGRKVIARDVHQIESIKITVERVLREYERIAFLDISGAFQSDGTLKSIHEMPEDIRRAIGGIEVSEITAGECVIGKLHKIKIIDKRGALADIARHLGMFTDRVEHSGPGGGSIDVSIRLRSVLDAPDAVRK